MAQVYINLAGRDQDKAMGKICPDMGVAPPREFTEIAVSPFL